jgi:peptide-methionine (S)-S-oxide reductase
VTSTLESVVVGGGCFWCVEAVYLALEGVVSVESGYAGGHDPEPDYKKVCSGVTGHAEVVRIVFDPAVVELGDILRIFFSVHDPTTLNRQGADVGTQYRSIILPADDTQEEVARAVLAEVDGADVWDDPIVTEITRLETFHPAEAYHQDYFARNPNQPYCAAVVAPKVAKFRKQFAHRLKKGA